MPPNSQLGGQDLSRLDEFVEQLRPYCEKVSAKTSSGVLLTPRPDVLATPKRFIEMYRLVSDFGGDPGFEGGPTGWFVSEGTATYTLDTSNPHSGSFCAKGVEVNAGSLGRLYQDVTGRFIPGGKYVISGWIKTQNSQGQGVVVALDYVGSNGWTPGDGFVMEIGHVLGTSGWTFYQSAPFTLPPMPSDATALWFLTDFNAGTGTAWFDDLSLTVAQ